MHCFSMTYWLVLTILFAIWGTSHFDPLQNVSKSFSFCCTVHSINKKTSFFASRYFLLMLPCFHYFHSLCFSLTLLLTYLFHQHVSLCVAGPFVHPQLLSVASSNTPFRVLQYPLTDAFVDCSLWTCWCMT